MSENLKLFFMDAPELTGYSEFNGDYSGFGMNSLPGNYNEIVIRNAGGVPYRLLCNSGSDDAYFSGAGEEINNLFGTAPGTFTEKGYRAMIEKFVPLEEGIPGDAVEARRKLLSGEIKNYRAEVQITTSAGEKKRIYEAAVPVADPATGVVIGVSGIFFDAGKWSVTKSVPSPAGNSEKEAYPLKMAFLRNFSHEIRTPLNAVIGFSTLLGEHFRDDGTAKEYIDMLMTSADRLLDTLDKVVEASLLQSGNVAVKSEEVNVAGITGSIYRKFKPQAEKKGLGLTLRPPSDKDDLIIVTDRQKISQVLHHLLENAIKFTAGGEVEFGYTMSDRMVDFFVRDTGIGIPQELREKVFDVFFQADAGPTRLYGGTGLGLSISKAYVEMLGGRLWFTSGNGDGTTFRFTVPDGR